MKVSLRLLLGIVSILPFVVSVFFIGTIFYLVRTDPQVLEEFFVSLHPLAGLIINIGLFSVAYGPVVFYVIHAGRNPDLADRKAVWIILMIFLGAFAMPIYWYLFIWQDSYYES
jgi:hypothetical protein